MTRPFRFGVVAAAYGTGEDWVRRARRVAELGFATLLTPDTLSTHAPLPALAAAAAAVPGLGVCPFVLAAPLRAPGLLAWEARSMAALTGGRFELGLGTGRPDARADAERLGVAWGTGPQRLDAVRATVAALRAGEAAAGAARTPVLVAASGPRALAAAAADADTVVLAARPTASRDRVGAMAAALRGHDVEIATNLFAVGDDLPPLTARWAGPDGERLLREPGCPARLRGSVTGMADELRRRRDEWGLSYVAVGERYAPALAPVVAALAGT
ncbi:LLM class flavin-dependent oxidoreductase [Pseudonocardia spirodelae]|uniref:LLM class flavin-dependent oxidoreductase n=1 Tax=Pseudonocardia spirodelae TaxID=3133431 RepID=A0ABU8TAI9_9PSEU